MTGGATSADARRHSQRRDSRRRQHRMAGAHGARASGVAEVHGALPERGARRATLYGDDEGALPSAQRTRAMAVPEDRKPLVMTGRGTRGDFVIAGGRSYVAALIKDAGGRYVWADNTAVGSAHDRPRSADPSRGERRHLDQRRRLADLAAMVKDEPGTPSSRPIGRARCGSTSGGSRRPARNDYWSRSVSHPDLVLADLVKIFHPTLVPEHAVPVVHAGARRRLTPNRIMTVRRHAHRPGCAAARSLLDAPAHRHAAPREALVLCRAGCGARASPSCCRSRSARRTCRSAALSRCCSASSTERDARGGRRRDDPAAAIADGAARRRGARHRRPADADALPEPAGRSVRAGHLVGGQPRRRDRGARLGHERRRRVRRVDRSSRRRTAHRRGDRRRAALVLALVLVVSSRVANPTTVLILGLMFGYAVSASSRCSSASARRNV